VVVLSNFNLSAPATLIEVAPVTWFGSFQRALAYAEGLVYGRKSDWRIPTFLDLLAIRRDRNLFRCPGAKRCNRGFANAVYFAANSNDGTVGLDFGSSSMIGFTLVSSNYVRPVRTIGPPPGQFVAPRLVPS
jgi:hypothetical protein